MTSLAPPGPPFCFPLASLDPPWLTKAPSRPPQGSPRGPQGAHKDLQGPSKDPQGLSKALQGPPMPFQGSPGIPKVPPTTAQAILQGHPKAPPTISTDSPMKLFILMTPIAFLDTWSPEATSLPLLGSPWLSLAPRRAPVGYFKHLQGSLKDLQRTLWAHLRIPKAPPRSPQGSTRIPKHSTKIHKASPLILKASPGSPKAHLPPRSSKDTQGSHKILFWTPKEPPTFP